MQLYQVVGVVIGFILYSVIVYNAGYKDGFINGSNKEKEKE